jgi:phosphoglycolate phosphatase-like HAD superfamily hydrolase
MSDDVLVLWDIDDTLLNSGGAGRDLYDAVFTQLFGRALEAHAAMDGRTDRAFILETLELAGIDEPRRYVDPFMAGLAKHAEAVHAAVAARGRALPGAPEVLAALAAARSVGSFAAFGTEFPGLIDWGTDTLAPAVPVGAVLAGAAQTASLATAPAAAMAGTSTTAVRTAVATAGPGQAGAGAAPATAVQTVQTAVAPAVRAQLGPAQATAGHVVAAQRTAARTVATQRLATHAAPLHPAASRRPVRRIYQSVLTGNIRAVAETKLAALGLRDGLDLCIGAYGEDHEDRTELVHVARRRAAGVHGRSANAFAGTSTVVIGNTPLDVSVALAAGARAVGVATGSYSAANLHAAGAHAVLCDLTDTRAVLRALLA